VVARYGGRSTENACAAFGAAQPDHQQRRRETNPEHHAPRGGVRQHGIKQRVEQRRGTPADGPAALHEANRAAAIFVADHLAHQHRARRPFGAKAEALQGAQREQLLEVLGEAAEEGEHRVPQHGDLQHADPPVAIAQGAGEPAAEGRDHQRDRAEQARLAARDLPGRKQSRNDKAVDLDVERIERPAAETPGHGPPLSRSEIPHPLEHPWASPTPICVLVIGADYSGIFLRLPSVPLARLYSQNSWLDVATRE
jgi:hypothetical protein